MSRDYDLKKVISWSLYDWANSAFATTVMAGFFPVFFKEYWSAGTSASVSTLQLGAANSVASVIVAAAAPFSTNRAIIGFQHICYASYKIP